MLEPQFVFLAACKAGRSEAVRSLFKSIQTLSQVYGFPVLLHKNQTPPLAVIISMLLINGKIDEDQAGALGLAHYPLTGAQLFRWKRWEMGPAEEVRARPLDSIASLLYRGAWDLVEHLFPTARQAGA